MTNLLRLRGWPTSYDKQFLRYKNPKIQPIFARKCDFRYAREHDQLGNFKFPYLILGCLKSLKKVKSTSSMPDYVQIISFLFRFLPNFSDFVVFIRIFIKKIRLLPTRFSSGSGRKPPNLPPIIFHCYIRICSWCTDHIKNSISTYLQKCPCWGSEKLKFPSKSTGIVLF